jgi:putative ABC transport system permease protein
VSAAALQVACAVVFVALAALLARRLRLGLSREIVIAAVRAIVQLAAVGALIALVFEVEALAIAFVAAMVTTAALTSGGRIGTVPRARARAIAAIGGPALGATGILIAVGAFDTTPRATIPVAGILIGGAMTATTLTGRRMLEGLRSDADTIEARLALGDRIRDALAPTVRQAIRTGLVPAIDQTRNVGIVTLPGTSGFILPDEIKIS